MNFNLGAGLNHPRLSGVQEKPGAGEPACAEFLSRVT